MFSKKAYIPQQIKIEYSYEKTYSFTDHFKKYTINRTFYVQSVGTIKFVVHKKFI